MTAAVRVNAPVAGTPDVFTTEVPARPPVIVIGQGSTRKVEAICPSANSCLSCLNAAAHVAAYAAKALVLIASGLGIGYLAATSVALFPPSIFLVLPGAISAGSFGMDVITNVFTGIHACIDNICG